MTIAVGEPLPQATFHVLTSDGVQERTTDDVFAGKKVVLFAVPGAFTPTCHKNHLPGYLDNAETIKDKGIDTIAVTSTNDAFVLDAWAKSTGAAEKIEFLADGNGDFAKALGLSLDGSGRGMESARSAITCLSRTGSGRGMGIRSQRYSMLVEDGIVKRLAVEEVAGKADISGAAALLKDL